jgi:hypothetical protein
MRRLNLATALLIVAAMTSSSDDLVADLTLLAPLLTQSNP